MPTVSAMTEHVQQRTSEKEQPRQNSKDVSPVLGQEQRAAYCEESEKNEAAARSPKAPR